jgi:hypothetical protein
MPNNMAKPADSTDSGALELQSLQREVNKNEFFDFLRAEQANFLNMRTLQASKIILLLQLMKYCKIHVPDQQT